MSLHRERLLGMCTDLSHLDDFSDIVTYTNNDKEIIGGRLSVFFSFWGGRFYPSNTLDRTSVSFVLSNVGY